MRDIFLTYVALVLFSIAFPFSFLFAQENDVSNYLTKQWEMKDGLPQSSANDILQTKDGYIWLATFGGLVRFDGVNFTTYNHFNTKGMRSERILNLFEDSHGALWLSTENGFIRFENGECTSYLIMKESQVYSPLKVTEDSRGVLWITAIEKIYRFTGTSFVEVPIIKDKEKADQAIHNRSGVWLAHGQQIFRTLGDSIFQLIELSSVLKNNIQDMVEYPKDSGIYFFATSGSGVGRYENGKTTFFTEKEGLSSVSVRKLFIDRENNLWVNCYNGLSKWVGNRFVLFNVISSSKEIQYKDILLDSEGNYWIGTSSQGLFKIRPALISTIGFDQGLKNDKMLSITKLKNGTFLFSANCGGIYEWDHKKAIYSSVNKYLPNLCVWSVFQDSKNRIWFGSRSLYVTPDLNKKGKVFEISTPGKSNEVFAINEDRNGNIWIGTLNGFFIYDGKTFQPYSTENGLSYNDTRVFYEDKSGSMWIGTSAGINKFKNDKITHIKFHESEKDSLHSIEPYIRAIYEDSDGTMWFGTYGNGLIRLKNRKVNFITTDQGLFDNIVSHIVEDENGNFWMGSNRGISRVSKIELDDLCDGKITEVHSFSYGEADGMESSETNGGFQPSIIKDSSGTVYFPTVSGVVRVSTRNVRYNKVPPPVVIEKLIANGNEIANSKVITLPYDSASLLIKYTALSFSEPNKVMFRYRLTSLNDTWFEAGSNRNAFYSKIPPGDYQFQVIACNNDGIWNTEGASLSITVLPPFWMTWWFRTLVVMFFMSFGPLIYYFKIRALKEKSRQQTDFAEQLIHSQEQERRRIASELHDGLGQQILVIKSRAELAMKSIQDNGKTLEHLQEITNSAISSINDVRSITHDLRPVYLEQFGLTETIKNLIDQVRQSSEIKWVYHIDNIDGIIKSEKEINFYRIVQEGINNVLKHSEASQASLMIRLSAENLTASLWDNGKGFDINEKKKSPGLGLTGILERSKSLGGWFEIKSEPNEGTTLKIIIRVGENG